MQLMREKFSTDFSESAIKSLMTRQGIKSGMKLRCPPEKMRRLTTPEQDAWIKANATGKNWKIEILQMSFQCCIKKTL